jgi:hypothetical protein
MGKLHNILSWPRRYRTSCGFGVHSPFAYEFITKVLCDYNAYYYAYPEIDAVCGKSRRDALIVNLKFSSIDYDYHEARMLFRMLCYFNPNNVVEIGGGNEVGRTITERAIPHATLQGWSRDQQISIPEANSLFIIVNFLTEENFTLIRSYIMESLNRQSPVVVFFRNMHLKRVGKLWREINAVINRGMSFHDNISCIYVANPKLPRQDYELTFS